MTKFFYLFYTKDFQLELLRDKNKISFYLGSKRARIAWIFFSCCLDFTNFLEIIDLFLFNLLTSTLKFIKSFFQINFQNSIQEMQIYSAQIIACFNLLLSQGQIDSAFCTWNHLDITFFLLIQIYFMSLLIVLYFYLSMQAMVTLCTLQFNTEQYSSAACSIY